MRSGIMTLSRAVKVKLMLVAAVFLVITVAAARPTLAGTFTERDSAATGLPDVYDGSSVWGDYDNDGLLDVLITGWTGTEGISRIYRNKGDGTFTNIAAGLPGVSYSSAAWGDYDNNGRLDVLITGYTGSVYISRIYRNQGGGVFADISAGLPGVYRSSAAWGDYDNDGRLDVLITGWTGSGRISRIYRNQGDGTFTDINAGLIGVENGSAAWGDYDNDGLLDVLITGYTGSVYISRIYRNQGGGVFADINAALIVVSYSSAAWGDYDNDGWLDVLITGWTASEYISRIYRNNGDGTFTDIVAGLPNFCAGLAVWGDYDNDGRLDVLITGSTGPTKTKVFHNNGDGTFTDIAAGLKGLIYSSAQWGDYNNDGWLDILIAGDLSGALDPKTFIYLNDGNWAGQSANTPPTAPTQTAAVLEGDGGRPVTLVWGPASDAQTPAAGLTYNVRLGTTPGGGDLCGPMADMGSGWRRVVQMGNAGQRRGARIEGLPPGVYYWSVQALDTAYAGSVWSTEGQFTVSDEPNGQTIFPGAGGSGGGCFISVVGN